MSRPAARCAPISILLLTVAQAIEARVNVVVVRNTEERATPAFAFRLLPSPSTDDVGAKAKWTVVDGERDQNGGELAQLSDGKLPTGEDQPAASFFFAAGTGGGRILVDLGEAIDLERVDSYSWHGGVRGPQVYTLFAAAGSEQGLQLEPKSGTEPERAGWIRLAKVDTRPERGAPGGQFAVSVLDSDGPLGRYRYLLFDVACTDPSDRFGNTFYSEIDIHRAVAPQVAPRPGVIALEARGGRHRFTIDTTDAPELSQWAEVTLAPVVQEWYPRIVELLPSDGFEAPPSFRIEFSNSMNGVAATGGTRVRCAGSWFRRNLEGEAKGAVVHELVHVVQQYGGRGRGRGTRPPGWLVEGIADYIRWFLYEPESRGAEISARGLERARHDASYRITANFIDWVARTHDKAIATKLNAAARGGNYDEAHWKEHTGRTLAELDAAWREDLAKGLAAPPAEKTDAPQEPPADGKR